MIVGIDYSMTCPAACVPYDTPQFWFANSRTYDPLPDIATYEITTADVTRRADTTALAMLAWLQRYPDVRTVVLEDYAFNATGRVFHIGEHTGILKLILTRAGYHVCAVPPTVVKKYATGKGNADKSRMTAAFLADYPTAQRWATTFFPRTRANASFAKSPLSDLADAYWIAKYAVTQCNARVDTSAVTTL